MGDPSDTIVVADVAPRTASQQITGFIDDAASVPASLPVLREPEDAMIAATMEERTHSIIDVLSRPVVVASGTWTDASVRDDALVNLDFPDAIFNSAVNVIDKLNFFTYLRADVCIRVVINANTFQQGKLLGYFTPFESLVGNRASASNHTPAFTAFPHVLVDASTGNVAELRIPYVAPYSSYRLTDNTGNIGTFYLRVLNSLISGDCEYTVYAWFTNISVDLPSGRENALGVAGQALANFKRFLRGNPDLTVSTVRRKNGSEKFVAQVAGEEQKKSSGIISSTLDTVATIATFGNEIPIIKEVAGPVSWVAKFAARVAEYFGYSKSMNVSTPCSMTQIPAKGFTNATGVDSSVLLGCTQDNQLEPRNDVFGSGLDDMHIPYLVKHRCYVDSFNMSTSQNTGTKLYSFPVTPGWCKLVNGVYRPSVTAFVASMFTLWRGGLKFKIQAAKTAYHSGRVRIVYLPATESDDVDDSDQAYNWVLDLRNSSEIEFTVPYNNIVEWSETRLIDDIVNTRSSSIGVIRIEVLNTLRAPDTVSPTIEFNVWMSGDSDLQFAIPSFQRYVPSLADTTLSRRRPDLNDDEHFIAQVLGSQQDRGFNDMEDKPQLFSMKVPDLVIPCKTAIGEAVNNLRYLTRRFAPSQTRQKTSTDLTLDLPLYYFTRVFDPNQDSLETYRITPIDYISYLYRFFRGGLRYKFLLNNQSIADNVGYQEAVLAPSFPSSRTITEIPSLFYDRLAVMSSSFMHRVYSLINPTLEVTTPFYSQAIIRPIVGTDQSQPNTLTANSLLYKWSSSGNGSVDIYKAAHDDFSFGWIVGPPTLRSRESGEIDADVSNAGGIIFDNDSYTIGNIQLSTVLTPGDYTILLSVPPTADLVLNDTSTIPMTPAILRVSATNTQIVFTHATTTETDPAATQAALQAIGTFGLLIA